MGVIEVTVLKWEKYNARSDVKHPTWFRFDHGFFDDPQLCDLDPMELLTLVYVFCMCSKKSSPTVDLYPTHAERSGRISKQSLLINLKKLENLGIIRTDTTAYDRVRTDTSSTLQTLQTDITDITLPPAPRTAAGKTLGSKAFDAYSEAYEEHYGEPPKRNSKLNSIFKRLGERLGDEAPAVAEFYLSHKDYLYCKSGHAVDLLLRDAEKLRTEWATGNKITSQYAKQAENSDHLENQLKRIQNGEL